MEEYEMVKKIKNILFRVFMMCTQNSGHIYI